MAFTRPTLQQIIDRVKSDYKTGLSLPTIIRRSFLDVFAKAKGGLSHTLHGHIEYAIFKKFFPTDGDEETVTRWGTLYEILRTEAQRAELAIEITGQSGGGGTLSAGRIFVRTDGTVYSLQAGVTVPDGGTVAGSIVENETQSIGASGNMEVSDTLTLQSPEAGIESTVSVTAVEVEGEDQESLENFRTRVLERLRFPPSGGKVTDFIAFAKKIAGVTRVWVLPNFLGPGTVGVTFVEDGNAPASIIPSQAKVDEVQEQMLEDEPQGTAGTTTFIPNETVFNPEIQIKPNTAEVQAAVIDELEDLILREAQVRDAVDPDQVGQGVQFDGRIKLSQINEAISLAAGEEDHVLLSPTSDVQPLSGGLVTLGTPVFTTLP